MSSPPRVTVLMPVYNGEKYIGSAIESILNQTFADFQFLIVDDRSTDRSADIIDTYRLKDPRIIVASNKKEKGIAGALNSGLDEARGDYIARMDQDDVSLPQRLMKQVQFMDQHPEVGVCGAWMNTIEESGSRPWFPFPSGHERIKIGLLFCTPLAHPTVMIRRAYFEKYGLRYEGHFEYAEDYELWTRCVDLFSLRNIPEVLLLYRVHASSMSMAKAQKQRALATAITRNQLKKIGLSPDEREEQIHGKIFFGPFEDGMGLMLDSAKWLLKLVRANRQHRYYAQANLVRELTRIYLSLCRSVLSRTMRNIQATAYRTVKRGKA